METVESARRPQGVSSASSRTLRAIALFTILGCVAFGIWRSGEFTRERGPAREWDSGALVAPWPLPEFSLRDDSGERFERADLLGRVWIIDLLSLHCSACRPLSGEIALLQEQLPGADVAFASFSVDLGDDASVLRSHRKRFPHVAGERWRMTPAELDFAPQLAVAFGAARTQKDATEGLLALTPRFYLVDRQARVCGAYYGMSATERQRLVDDARSLLAQPR